MRAQRLLAVALLRQEIEALGNLRKQIPLFHCRQSKRPHAACACLTLTTWSVRLGQSCAAVAANAVALRHTGIDVLQEMAIQPEELIAGTELTVVSGEADQLADRVKGWLDSSPAPDVTSDEIIAGLGLAVAGHERKAAETRIGILMSHLGWRRRERSDGANEKELAKEHGITPRRV